jgi:two-component system sensor histidine kinase KdpD
LIRINIGNNSNLYLLGSPHGGGGGGDGEKPVLFRKAPPPGLHKPSEQRRQERYWRYSGAVLIVGACTLVAKLMFGGFDLANLVMVYLVGVILTATRFGQGPSILASVLAVGAFDFLFVTPYYSFKVSDTQYLVTLVGMLTVAMVISHLMANVRYQARVAGHRERRATVLYRMSRELAAARSEADIVRIAVRHVHAEFGGRNVILFPNDHGRIVYPDDKPLAEASLRGADLGVAQWVYDHNEPAGQGTHTLAGAGAAYFPLGAENQAMGVLALLPVSLRRIFLPEQRQLLETFLNQVAHALERVRLAERARAVAVDMEAERLRNSLLSSISHDLRTPLATIVGSASALAERDEMLADTERKDLSRTIFEEASRMASLITNILDMARLEAGAVKLNRQWHVLEELIGSVLNRLEARLRGRTVSVRLPRDMPLILVDGVLLEQVLANLLDNAAKYSPPGTPIEITAENSAFTISLSVADRGPGIPAGQEEKLFEKFARAHPEGAQSGVGLGLAICRAIVEAHGGWIRAKNRGTGGAIFTFTLPVDQAPPGIEPEPLED